MKRSINRLLSRDDVTLTQDRVNHYVRSGQWSDESFIDYLEHHARTNPNGIAIVEENGKRITFADYHHQTNQIASALLELGLKPEDRIAIQLPNWSEYILSLMGAAKAGILPVLCHMPYNEHDLDYVMNLTQAKAIIIPDVFKNRNYLEMIRNVKETTSLFSSILSLFLTSSMKGQLTFMISCKRT